MRLTRFLIGLLLFWVGIFVVHHALFLLFNSGSLSPFHPAEFLRSFLYGLIMDLAVSAYFLMGFILLCLVTLPFKPSLFLTLNRIMNIILIVVSTFLLFADIGLYQAWGVRINAKALSVVFYPQMMTDAVLSADYRILIPAMLALTGITVWIYLRLFRDCTIGPVNRWAAAAICLAFLPLLVIGARGGTGKFPLGKSRVFFSDAFIYNYSALNSCWNFGENLMSLKENTRNPYAFFSDGEAQAIVDTLLAAPSDPTGVAVVNIGRPNIVIILMESLSADNMARLGGIGTTPFLDHLFDNSLAFTRFYANGHRSEHGLIALLSGFPPLPDHSLQRESNRVVNLPVMPRLLKDSLGYTLNLFQTYSLDYARIDEYLRLARFDKVLAEPDFGKARKHQWGVYDEVLFDRALTELQSCREPFFSMILTSVAHEPFGAEVTRRYQGAGTASGYMDCIYYSDSCLAEFFRKAEKEPWFGRTLFLITADHGHPFPRERTHQDPGMYHVPLLLCGGALNEAFSGKRIDRPCSQMDIPATLLTLTGLNPDAFRFSRDLLNPPRIPFAFFTFDDCFGMITPTGQYTYHLALDRLVAPGDPVKDSLALVGGKAFLQVLYGEFMNLNR